MIIKYKKLFNTAIRPTKSKDGDAAYDLYCNDTVVIKPMERKIVPTGISIEIPNGYYGRIAPRSGLSINGGVDVMAGVVDSNYRGEIGVILINLNLPEELFSKAEELLAYNHLFDSHNTVRFEPGDRIAQLIIEKCYDVDWEEVDELSDTSRHDGGFGSTGK